MERFDLLGPFDLMLERTELKSISIIGKLSDDRERRDSLDWILLQRDRELLVDFVLTVWHDFVLEVLVDLLSEDLIDL